MGCIIIPWPQADEEHIVKTLRSVSAGKASDTQLLQVIKTLERKRTKAAVENKLDRLCRMNFGINIYNFIKTYCPSLKGIYPYRKDQPPASEAKGAGQDREPQTTRIARGRQKKTNGASSIGSDEVSLMDSDVDEPPRKRSRHHTTLPKSPSSATEAPLSRFFGSHGGRANIGKSLSAGQ